MEFESSINEWVELDCRGTDTQCKVLMSKLSIKNNGDLIKIRVAAVNAEGQGLYSKPNLFGAQMIELPKEIGKPTVLERTKDMIRLTWPFK